MKDKRIDAIRNLADEISTFIESSNNANRLSQLEMAKNYHSFRNVLRLIGKNRLALDPKDPLVKFDDYVNYLFPEGALSWGETRDLILFRIYEKLHDYLKANAGTMSEEEME